jgi:5-methylcytosine-specific restriction endonuclease McrA
VKRGLLGLLAVLVLASSAVGCGEKTSSETAATSAATIAHRTGAVHHRRHRRAHHRRRAKPAGVPSNVPMPNRTLTPGASLAGVTASQVCTSGWASAHRSVSSAEKSAVYAEYGIASHAPGSYEVDHLIPLELGGSNSESNLWPEPYGASDGASAKDGLEDLLHAEVCAGNLTLRKAQREIAANWYAAWIAAGKPVGPKPASSGGSSRSTPTNTPASNLHGGEFCSPAKQRYYRANGYSCKPASDGRNRLFSG